MQRRSVLKTILAASGAWPLAAFSTSKSNDSYDPPHSQLLLMTILPPYEPYLLTRHPSSFYQPEGAEGRRRQYNDVIRNFAQEKQLPLLDMGQRFASVGNLSVLAQQIP